MGGGGAIRAAAKVAGIGVVNHGLRGMPAVPPAGHSVRNASRPVSAILTSSTSAPNSGSGDVAPAQQMPVPAAWDDWDFADGEEGLVMEAGEPMPRLIFGGVPSFQEAKDATAELKDALDMYNFDQNLLLFAFCFLIPFFTDKTKQRKKNRGKRIEANKLFKTVFSLLGQQKEIATVTLTLDLIR
jgi:hypothetical protein